MPVRVEGLTAGYGNIKVLHDISVEIGSGRICALIGRNGSGKTTLMRCINGILKPSKGSISVSGREIRQMKRDEVARLISLVPQGNYSPFQFSCLEMVLMGGASRIKPWSAPCAKEKRRAQEICREVGVADLVDRPFNCLSGGQKQLIMLARALHQDSPVMLLDEPNAHLDFPNQHRMMGMMRRFVKERGVTALITLHDPNLALQYSDDVVMLKDGRVVAAGPTELLLDDVHLHELFGAEIMVERTVSGTPVVVPRNPAREN
jgi:iron complex transport system ATP-binding protein